MLESVWYFFLFFGLGVFLPIMVVWALVKLFLHFFGVNAEKSGKKADDKIARSKDDIMSTAGNDRERCMIGYFLSHDESVVSDSEFLPRMRAMRSEMKSRRIERPGMEKILDYEAGVVDDGRCLERRLPNANKVFSLYRRTLIFFSNEEIAVVTLDGDMVKGGEITENGMTLRTERVLEVTAPKWTPPVHVDGHLERGNSWSIKFLLRGGTTKTLKGFPDDSKEIAEELDRRVKALRGMEK